MSNNNEITVITIPLEKLSSNETKLFFGQKVLHPFVRELYETTVKKFNKKKNSEYDVQIKSMGYCDKFISSEVENSIKNTNRFEIKHDGCCGFIKYDSKSDSFTPYTRFDVKKNKKTGQFDSVPSEWIPCEPLPTSPDATHWPHFRQCIEDSKLYQHQLNAFNHAQGTGTLNKAKGSFTCEYMGKKINYCSMDPIEQNALIVPHGSYQIQIPSELRTFDGFKMVFTQMPDIEGIMAYGEDGTIYKIRRDMYQGLIWPDNSLQELSTNLSSKVALG
mgnify:CR=1 FL=1